MASAAPALIRGSDTLYDHRLLAAEPWPLHVDRRDTGNFDMWRHMVWRTLAHQRWQAYVRNRPETFAAEALFTYDLQDIAFQRHDQYRTMRALAAPRLPLLILLEGIDPPFVRETVQALLRALVPSRRALGLTTWVFHLDANDALFRTPALPHGVGVQPPYYLPDAAPLTLQAGSEAETSSKKVRPRNQLMP